MRRFFIAMLLLGQTVFSPAMAGEKMANGLWAGTVSADAVSVPAQDREGGPAPVASPFGFPIILYVDDEGAQLVDEAVIVRSVRDPGASDAIALPRLYLDMGALAADLVALGVRDMADVSARRMATAAYSMPAPVRADGEATAGRTLRIVLALEPGKPTHPFRHQYHPDHDNLADDYTPLSADAAEVPALRRALGLTLDTVEEAVVRGRFAETIEGLHAVPLAVEGRFELDRVSALEVER